MSRRVYTPVDERIDHALALAGSSGLVDSKASESAKVRSLILFAEERLTAELELAQRISAYERLALDQDRAQAIDASVLAAVEDGIL